LNAILVIKFGALGDFAQALGPFAAIRAHHARDSITLLTTPPFVEFARASGLFDAVRGDGRNEGWIEPYLLVRHLAAEGYSRVYDLQTSRRSSLYFRFWPRPKVEWSGIARGCSHPHANPHRDLMHTIERQAEQLAMAGIPDVPAGALDFAQCDPARFGIRQRFALLAPGGAAHRPAKRWPVEGFVEAARALNERGLIPIVVGHGRSEAALADAILGAVPSARSIVGATTLTELAGLYRHAALALGNDTGPMHFAALAGTPSVVLFGSDSDPALCAPRGSRVAILQTQSLTHLETEKVLAALDRITG
jgi:ADP-heptose:LPS heptosyltransferase